MNPTDPTTSSILLVRSSILELRGQRALIDQDLARFYGVTTRRLKEQVRRNPTRFPEDFVFQLTLDEKAEVVAKCDHLGNIRFFQGLPLAFTEHGAIMAASVLNTPQAVQMSVYVVRAFVAMRQAPSGPPDLAAWLREIGTRLDDHDDSIRLVAQALEELLSPIDTPPPRPLGFRPDP
jgi:hypothetical protein